MTEITFKIPRSNVTIHIDESRLNEFVVLKLLHQDNVHTIRIDELTPEIARDVQYYIDTGMITRDETVTILELLGNDVNVEKLPQDMVKLYLAEERFRKEVNKEDSSLRNFENLIELNQDTYEQMRDVAIAYRENIPQLLKSKKNPSYPEWSSVQKQVNNMINRVKNLCDREIFPERFYDNYMIAGGSVASILHDKFFASRQDIDVFIVAPDEDLRQEMKEQYHIDKTYIRQYKTKKFDFSTDKYVDEYEDREIRIRYNDNVVSINTNKNYEIQVVKRFYKIFDQILHGFDVDASCVGVTFDGRIWMTQRFRYAFMKNCLTVNINRLSRTYETRLAKYYRRGWDLYIPGTLVESVPPIEMELDNGVKVNFTEIDSKLDPRWNRLSVMFNSLPQEGRNFLMGKLRANWYRFDGIDLLWIATRDECKFETKGYNKSLSVKHNDVWRVDEPDSQHTGSFEPIPRDTRWFNVSVDKYVESYLPIARLVSKYNLHKRAIRKHNTKTGEDYQVLAPTIWRMNLAYEFTIYDTTIYIADYMVKRFLKIFDVKYSDMKPTKYMLMKHISYYSVSYLIDLETDLVVGTLENISYGKIVPVYITMEEVDEEPKTQIPYIIKNYFGILVLPPFKLVEGLIKSYYSRSILEYENVEGHPPYFSRLSDIYQIEPKDPDNGEPDYIDVEHSPEFMKWYDTKLKHRHWVDG